MIPVMTLLMIVIIVARYSFGIGLTGLQEFVMYLRSWSDSEDLLLCGAFDIAVAAPSPCHLEGSLRRYPTSAAFAAHDCSAPNVGTASAGLRNGRWHG